MIYSYLELINRGVSVEPFSQLKLTDKDWYEKVIMCVYPELCACTLTGDLFSGLVGRGVTVCVYPDRRPVFGSCRQGCDCVRVP